MGDTRSSDHGSHDMSSYRVIGFAASGVSDEHGFRV